MLNLPGAGPIEARIEDYNDPNSLWVVASKDRPLDPQSYRPSDLEFIANGSRTDKSNDERSLRAVVAEDFQRLIADAKTAGYDLMIGSGFRTYELQKLYYTNYARINGQEQADKYSSKPGYSEHQTGLAFDITLRSMECYISVCFGDTAAGKWVATRAVDYGFILRYPADKTEVTKYQYEPWHLRYVGRPLAKALTESELTLDEAYSYLQKTRAELIKSKQITVSE